MKRRQFLVVSTLSVALLAALPARSVDLAGASSKGGSIAPMALDELARGVTGFEAGTLPPVQDLGATRERLLKRLNAVFDGESTPERALQGAIQEDHAKGRVREVDGWVLAETEFDLLVYSASLHARAGTSTRVEPITAATAPERQFVTVKAWGPQKACAGSGFNMQSDGHSSIWLQVGADAPAGLVVLVDGTQVGTTQADGVVTTRLDPPDIERHFSKPGSVRLELFHAGQGVRQFVGEFTVTAGGTFATTTAGTTSKVFREVRAWGPRRTRRGEPFNAQASGSSTIWVQTSCAPRNTRLRFGADLLDTKVGPGVVTASLKDAAVIASEATIPVHLVDTRTGEEVLLGTFEVGR